VVGFESNLSRKSRLFFGCMIYMAGTLALYKESTERGTVLNASPLDCAIEHRVSIRTFPSTPLEP
jgi:hypothetical protein